MSNKAIVLLSGGLDSSVTAFIAKEKKYDLYALSFQYGQQHEKEIQAAKKIAHQLPVKKHLVLHLPLDKLGGSSLLKQSTPSIPSAHTLNEIGKTIPSTYVPARNTIFLSFALSYAETQKANAIYLGVTAADYSGYPDCRPAYINAYQQLANLATKRAVNGCPISIVTPLLHLSKKEIVQQGMHHKVPFEHTWSCYKGSSKACGACDSCLLRLKGFQQAGYNDPLTYETYPDWYTHH